MLVVIYCSLTELISHAAISLTVAVSNQRALATLATAHIVFLYELILLNILLFSLLYPIKCV